MGIRYCHFYLKSKQAILFLGMLSKIFLGLSLVGAEWVLYFLIIISTFSLAIILERIYFYRTASKQLSAFRSKIREATTNNQIETAIGVAKNRKASQEGKAADLEAEMALALLTSSTKNSEILGELAQDAVTRGRLNWDRNLSILATIGSNAPFVGLFGTVLGIIKAFHDLSLQSAAGTQTITSGISEALVATAVGLLVAIPAVVAFNLFQRRVKIALSEAEALKSFLIGKLSIRNQ